jgi:hypothetical protein
MSRAPGGCRGDHSLQSISKSKDSNLKAALKQCPRWQTNFCLEAKHDGGKPRFVPKIPVQLFEKRSLQNTIPQYDVSPDGKRFIILERPENELPLSIHVVHNWFAEFRDQRGR